MRDTGCATELKMQTNFDDPSRIPHLVSRISYLVSCFGPSKERKINNFLRAHLPLIRTYSLVLNLMKPTSSKGLLLFLLIPLTHLTSSAQDLTGIWRGYFVTQDYSNYKFELQINQTENSISGVSYSYLNTVFYGKATLTGSFNKDGQSALIREIRTVELRMSGGSSACIMKCFFEYSQSGKEQFLEGTYTSKHEKDNFGVRKGDDCGGGKVYLRKVTTSDFYVEPFLREKVKTVPVIVNKTPVKKDTAVVKPPVVVKNTGNTKPPGTTTKPVTKSNTNTTKVTTPTKQKVDSITKITPPVVKNNPPKEIITTPNVLQARQNELVKTLIVNSPDVIVKLYDNGEIDDDTISVFHNKKLILSSQRLTAVPLTIKIHMDADNAEHELVMVAENLGRIPPNTSLMIVESGEQRFDVRISSTEQKNAVVRFKYQKQSP